MSRNFFCALPELFQLADVALFEELVGVVVDAELLLAAPDRPELWCLGRCSKRDGGEQGEENC